uniref:Mucin 2 n=1 Tax=Tineola bisselliella TaxID=93883 RepID=A0A891XIB2_TINBI|nr:mucin 2 [Tineola bisselliella]
MKLKILAIFVAFVVAVSPTAEARSSGHKGALSVFLKNIQSFVPSVLKDLGKLKIPGEVDNVGHLLDKGVARLVKDLVNQIIPGLGDHLGAVISDLSRNVVCNVGSAGLIGFVFQDQRRGNEIRRSNYCTKYRRGKYTCTCVKRGYGGDGDDDGNNNGSDGSDEGSADGGSSESSEEEGDGDGYEGDHDHGKGGDGPDAGDGGKGGKGGKGGNGIDAGDGGNGGKGGKGGNKGGNGLDPLDPGNGGKGGKGIVDC